MAGTLNTIQQVHEHFAWMNEHEGGVSGCHAKMFVGNPETLRHMREKAQSGELHEGYIVVSVRRGVVTFAQLRKEQIDSVVESNGEINMDQTFINAIQSRLNAGDGFYTDGGKALWTNDVRLYLEDGIVTDIWCDLSMLDGLEFDASLNYGDIHQYA